MRLSETVRDHAEKTFSSAKGSHDWEHTLRVYNLALHIGEKEGADLEILKLAAILHDIGREHQDQSGGKIDHAEKGAELAEELLKSYGLEEEKIRKVTHCIETHRFRGSKAPISKEAKILFDADKLDSIGAVGIGRAFLFSGEIGAKLHDKDVDIENTSSYSRDDTAYREYLIKLRKVKDRLLTEEGRRIAEERHKFMAVFFDRLNKEVDGLL